MTPQTVSGAPAAAYVGALMRNRDGVNVAKVSRDAARARTSRPALERLRLAACKIGRSARISTDWPCVARTASRRREPKAATPTRSAREKQKPRPPGTP